MLFVGLFRVRAFFLRKYVNRGMAFHRLVVVASLPATFPTLGRGHPNMTEQAALTRVNLGQQTLYEVSMGGSPLSGLVGGLAKARQVLDFTRQIECRGFASLEATWPARRKARKTREYFPSLYVWRARSIGARPSRSTLTLVFSRGIKLD